jgi:hypothetical protein
MRVVFAIEARLSVAGSFQRRCTACRFIAFLSLKMQAIFDRSVLEVYMNGGLKSGTVTLFPYKILDTVSVKLSSVERTVVGTIRLQQLDRYR